MNEGLDDIVARALPAEKLLFLENNKKDLLLCYFGETSSPFPMLDLRALPANENYDYEANH